MPLYEFICTTCDIVFEELLPVEHEIPACPRCASTEHVSPQLSVCVTRTDQASCSASSGFS
ncbi:hypothetical protein MASR1M90_15190 [Desulfovibrionales bacterium]